MSKNWESLPEAGIRQRLGEMRRAWTLRRSGLFLSVYYREHNPDVADYPASALYHYLRFGGFNGAFPNPYFDSNWYLDGHPELRPKGINPLYHYCLHGLAELRDPGPHFSTSRYLELYPDVARTGMNPLRHFLWHGIDEGRVTGLEA